MINHTNAAYLPAGDCWYFIYLTHFGPFNNKKKNNKLASDWKRGGPSDFSKINLNFLNITIKKHTNEQFSFGGRGL